MASTDVLKIIDDLKRSTKRTPDYIEFDDGNLVLWTASLVLLNHIGLKGSLKGKRVLELGSGLGHLAVGLYRLIKLFTTIKGGLLI